MFVAVDSIKKALEELSETNEEYTQYREELSVRMSVLENMAESLQDSLYDFMSAIEELSETVENLPV